MVANADVCNLLNLSFQLFVKICITEGETCNINRKWRIIRVYGKYRTIWNNFQNSEFRQMKNKLFNEKNWICFLFLLQDLMES